MRAINSSVMKEMNRKLVLESIRRRPISRAELSAETQLTRASITQIVDGLMQQGLVVETASVDRKTPGRRQTQLALVEDAMCIAGMYLNKTGYDLGLINLGGKVLWKDHGENKGKEFDEVMDETADKLRAAVDLHCAQGTRLYALGVSAPGPIDCCPEGTRNWHDFSQNWRKRLTGELKKRLDWDIHIGNISNSYALDELYFGIGCQGAENFMVLRVDETVGAGFIIEGKLFVGARGFSPELGHITLVPQGLECHCGNRGCLERYISIPAVLNGTPYTSWRQVMDSMDQEPAAAELFHMEMGTLAFEIVNLANVLDLDKVVISGDLVYKGERLAEKINRCMDECYMHRMKKNSVLPGREVNIVQIAAMPAYHSFFSG